jgi:hypothetical protein
VYEQSLELENLFSHPFTIHIAQEIYEQHFIPTDMLIKTGETCTEGDGHFPCKFQIEKGWLLFSLELPFIN